MFNQKTLDIKAEDIPHVFDRFKKTDRAENTGYGLGLAIVKSIANYLNLKVQVNSIPGEGAIFKVIFEVEQFSRNRKAKTLAKL